MAYRPGAYQYVFLALCRNDVPHSLLLVTSMNSEKLDIQETPRAAVAGPEAHIEKGHDSKPQRVLLCGHRSFAARGLMERLQTAGHQVICFSRGIEDEKDDIVTGPVARIHTNPHLSGDFDTLINYILLKEESPER